MKYSAFLVLTSICFCTTLIAQSPLPDHLILTWKDNPATTQSATWRTSVRMFHPVVQYTVATASPYGTENALEVQAVESRVETEEGKPYYYYSATLSDLDPGTQYLYRVGQTDRWSEWHHFHTAPDEEKPFSFIYLGDIQNDILSWGSRTVRAAYTQAPRAAFTLFAGDCVDHAHRNQEWMEWFDILGHLSASKPIVPVTGNHEFNVFNETTEERTLSVYWPEQFELPPNGPEGLKESTYYMDYQSMRLIVLNTTEALRSSDELEKQTEWLKDVLADNTQKWTVVSFHHALFSARDGRHGDYPDLRNAWQPIFEQYGVDLVLMGHDHVYARASNKHRTIDVPDGQAGPVYLVSVAGPKMYGLLPEKRWMERAAVNTQMYQVISIDGDELQFRAYTATDELYDSFDLKKQEGTYNLFEDHIDHRNNPENKFPNGRFTRDKK